VEGRLSLATLEWAEEEFGVESSREVWLCDSFEGLPAPTLADASAERKVNKAMDPAGSYAFGTDGVGQVRATFEKFQLLDGRWGERIHFIKGWFNETMPALSERLGPIGLLRADGDMYSSTMDVLVHLYTHLCVGCWMVFDDYGWWPQCKLAVHDFFEPKGVDMSKIVTSIDGEGVWFVKTSALV